MLSYWNTQTHCFLFLSTTSSNTCRLPYSLPCGSQSLMLSGEDRVCFGNSTLVCILSIQTYFAAYSELRILFTSTKKYAVIFLGIFHSVCGFFTFKRDLDTRNISFSFLTLPKEKESTGKGQCEKNDK